MSWNYRVCSYTDKGDTLFGIREVYYERDGSVKGVAAASSSDWSTPDEVKNTIDKMRAACELPVLSLDLLDKNA